MAGYLGTKAVFLSTTAASVGGDATIGGDLTVDTNTLYVDGTNNRVGIGTSSPSAPLTIGYSGAEAQIQINNSGDSRMVYLGAFNENEGILRLFNSSNVETVRIPAESTESVHTYFNAGNVGIGTSSPTNGKLVVENNGSNIYLKQTTGDYGHVIGQNDADGALTFSRRDGGNTERLRLDASGNLLVGGTTHPDTAYKMFVKVSGSTGGIITRPDSDNYTAMGFRNAANGSAGGISVSTSSTSYNTSSDYRLKEDWQPMTGASDRVLALNPVNFAWKVDGSRVDGFLAHEAQAVVPEAVTGTQDAVDAEGNPVYQGIDQSKLVPLLTAALKEALTEIADLKARVTALETA